MVHLRSLKNQRQVEEVPSVQCSLAALQARSANVRELVGATFYLFWFIFFVTLPLATKISELSRISLGILILQNFLMYFAFAANVFVILLVLHCVQWVVSSRIRAYAFRLNVRDVA
jgi:hypothetical protein